VLKPLHQFSRLEHIRCYPKSTLPLSENCALVILLTKYHPDHPTSVPVLMLGLLPNILCNAASCTATHGPATTIAASIRQLPLHLLSMLLLMTLPLPLLHLHFIPSHHVAHSTATTTSALHPLSSCRIVLLIALPLLTATLQLSY